MLKGFIPKQTVFILLLLVLFHLVVNFIWITLNTAPLPWDQAGHTRLAIEFADYFKSLGFLRIVDYFSISSYYPPLIHTMVGVLIVFLGHPIQVGGVVVTVFFAASIILLYVYSQDLFKNHWVALLSAVIYSFCPIIFEHSRWFLLDMPLLTFILASLICLNRSFEFSNSKYTKLFFIFAALALTTKWVAVVYLAFPLVLMFISRLKNRNQDSISNHFLKYFGVFLIITLPWYLINFASFIPQIFPNLQGESSDPTSILSSQNFMFYIYLLINFQMTLFLAILFIIGCFYFIFKSKSKQKILVGGYILFIYLVFSFISNKDWRYTMPILPFASIIVALFLAKLREKFLLTGSIFIVLTVLFLISYYISLSFRPGEFHFQRAIRFPIIGWIDYININDNLAHSYDDTLWPQAEILKSINTKGLTWVLCLADQEKFNSANFLLERDLLNIKNIEVESPPSSILPKEEEARGYLTKYSYVIITRDNVINPATRNAANYIMLKTIVRGMNSSYSLIQSYALPNGDVADLYKKTDG